MKYLLSGLALLTLMATLTTVPTGCTKTNTTRDTVTVLDTVTKTVTDTLLVTSYADSAGVHVWDSLWAYYPFNGNTNDTSGNNHVLALNGPRLGYDMYGNVNGSLAFTGGSGYAEIADGANFTTANYSISVFVQPKVVSGFYVSKAQWSNALGSTFNIGVDPVYNTGTIKVNIATNTEVCTVIPGPSYADTNYILLNPKGTVQPDSWYHVVYTMNNGVASLYINGVLANSYTLSNAGYDCSGSPFILGNFWEQDNGPAFTGNMDELRIYDRAITAKEVQYIYKTYMNRWGQ
jgi:hypothetical protein